MEGWLTHLTHNGLFLRLPKWHYALKHRQLLFMAKFARGTEYDRVTPIERREGCETR